MGIIQNISTCFFIIFKSFDLVESKINMLRKFINIKMIINIWLFTTGMFLATYTKPLNDFGKMPYELAFSHRRFTWQLPLSVSPDGNYVAYVVKDPPTEINRDGYFAAGGVPSLEVGNRIYITNLKDGNTIEASPFDASSWFPSWSPNSQFLAFYSDAEGQTNLWLFEIEKKKFRKVSSTLIKPMVMSGGKPQWDPESKIIYIPIIKEQKGDGVAPVNWQIDSTGIVSDTKEEVTVTVFKSGSELEETTKEKIKAEGFFYDDLLRDYNSTIAAVDINSGSFEIVIDARTDPRPMIIRVSPSGRWISYLSVFNRSNQIADNRITMDLAVVQVGGTFVQTIATGLLNLNEDYSTSNYSWHPKEDKLVFIKDNRLWLINFGPSGPQKPKQLAADLGEIANTLHWFTKDGNSVIVGVKPENKNIFGASFPNELALVPLDNGHPILIPFDNNRWNYTGILKTDATTIWQPDNESVTLKLREKSTGENAIVRIDIASGKQTVLWKGLAKINHLTAGGGHEFIMGIYEDYSTPPNVFRFASNFSSKERISIIEPRLDEVVIGKTKIFESSVPLYNGKIEKVRTAVLFPPRYQIGKPLPAIVMIYPGSDFSNFASFYGGGAPITIPVHLFVSRGFTVILTNIKIGPSGEAGNPVQEIIDVLLPQVYKAAELGYINIEKVGIIGQSYGGYSTAAVISKTNLFKAAVTISGYYDLVGTYGRFINSMPFGNYSESGQGRMGTHPWDNLKRYIDNSPYYQVEKILTPLLIIQGKKDLFPEEGEKLFNALRRFNRSAQLAMYEGEGHVIENWTLINAVDVAKRIVKFFKKYLDSIK